MKDIKDLERFCMEEWSKATNNRLLEGSYLNDSSLIIPFKGDTMKNVSKFDTDRTTWMVSNAEYTKQLPKIPKLYAL